jgi:DnaJ-domain-containing protein 1
MSEPEIEAEIRRDTVWQRPTWKLGERHSPGPQVRDPFGFYAGKENGRRANGRSNRHGANGHGPNGHRANGHGGHAGDAAARAISAREQALAVFDLEAPFTPLHLKARYKTLVKQHHPDAHGGDKAAEEKLKIINQAYATLKASYFN